MPVAISGGQQQILAVAAGPGSAEPRLVDAGRRPSAGPVAGAAWIACLWWVRRLREAGTRSCYWSSN